MDEIWKDIDGYEGLYKISNKGRVRSKRKILKNLSSKQGYWFVQLSKNGIVKNNYIHRLVAEAFVPNKNNFTIINHKDECKTNNIPENLEWCTQEYNNKYGTRLKKILQYSLNGELINEWESATHASKALNIDRTGIIRCCRGISRTCNGSKWRYKQWK